MFMTSLAKLLECLFVLRDLSKILFFLRVLLQVEKLFKNRFFACEINIVRLIGSSEVLVTTSWTFMYENSSLWVGAIEKKMAVIVLVKPRRNHHNV